MGMLNWAGGLVVMCAASQFPEFSQQYVQRLGGAVDALRVVADDFDRSAEGVGLTRAQALASMTGNAFQEARQADMARTFARLNRLETDLGALTGAGAGAVVRATQVTRFTDGAIAARVWENFRPALPLTPDGMLFALGGFLLGFGATAGVGRAARGLRRTAAA